MARRNRLYWFACVSAVLHLLLLWLFRDWGAERIREVLRPVIPPPVAADLARFDPVRKPVLPKALLEQIRRSADPDELPTVTLPDPGDPMRVVPHLDPSAPDSPAFEERVPGGPGDDDLGPESFADRMEELQRWRLRSLPLADTTSAAAMNRRRAEEIVDRAIEAMGGLDRLVSVQDMTVAVEIWGDREFIWDYWESVWRAGSTRYYRRGTGFREDLQEDISQGTDTRVSWSIRYGVHIPAPDLRQQAERWDFLSQFRGDGVVVEYVGTRVIRGRKMEGIRVLDVKYGSERTAWFDPRTGLHGRSAGT